MAEADSGVVSDRIVKEIAAALVDGALPGEIEGFSAKQAREAAAFAAGVLATRVPGRSAIGLETFARGDARRLMRLAIVNDNQPFLVDSVSAAVARHGLAIDRLLHPVVAVTRDADGTLVAARVKRDKATHQESVIYLEVERADARNRKALVADLRDALSAARRAVNDWPAMIAAMQADAALLGDGEPARLLAWFLDRNLTQLGHQLVSRTRTQSAALGVCRPPRPQLLADKSIDLAFAYFDRGEGDLLLIKSNVLSTVHRAVPFDLIIVPRREGKRVVALSIHAGLWTSAALGAPPQDVPMLRERLQALQAKLGFDPAGHAGKALAHAITALPHDLVVAFAPDVLERVALTAMSLADRPRPKATLVPGPLGRHLFAFVWLPRDELSTDRREAIGTLLEHAASATILNWTIQLDEGSVALIRYTLDMRDGGRVPPEARIDAELEAMVRGWSPAVERALAADGEAATAVRLALRYAASFPMAYRTGAGPAEAARDITRIAALDGPADRGIRLYRNDGDLPARLRLKLYSLEPVSLSDSVPALENFGFSVIEEMSTPLDDGRAGHIQKYVLERGDGADAAPILANARTTEQSIAAVLRGAAENDAFNRLIVSTGLDPQAVVLLRAWFRYLRQTGMAYGLETVVEALRRAPDVTRALIHRFHALHDPAVRKREAEAESATRAIERGLAQVAAIDDDRILRTMAALVQATLRTNAFSPAASEALAFKLASGDVPGLPNPRPWREIWVYSPRVEGIHLRAGPVARGGLRWSDRRDDFRTEILGLMKAQRVKNAVIVPTGAKGGFYPKQLPSPANRDAWLTEGTESYRIFIRALLSVTDNIVADRVVHPADVVIRDDDDPYFVVAADKGTATFSDVANAIALDHGFWLGDAFASGGSVGYDHKAMGITAKGAWVSVQRHFAELGIDVQSQPVRVAGCGDMSGDVFGNGMLLSKAIRLIAAFDHRHIFIDPDPDPAVSWAERKRLFALPRSSWDDYDKALISKGGGVFPRTAKSIKLSKPARAALGIDAAELDPAALISAILKSPVDLIWFGGIGTYVKAASESNAEVGDRANDGLRVNAEQLRCRAVGEGANLGVTQAARIAFAARGGRINTDFIDNSAGVDCSDNEVNIKIALNRDVAAGKLAMPDRNALLAAMTDDVAALVLEDNRLQTLALSIAERDGADSLPAHLRLIETFEAAGRLDRAVEGIAANDVLLRRAADGLGLTRPELAVLLATAKLALQEAIEQTTLGQDAATLADLHAAFPPAMRSRHREAIETHRLRSEIIATKLANRIVNRMGVIHPFELAEEEGVSPGLVAEAFVIAEQVYDIPALWQAIDDADLAESTRLMLFEQVAVEMRAHMADIMRNAVAGRSNAAAIATYRPLVDRLAAELDGLLPGEARNQTEAYAKRLAEAGTPRRIVERLVRLAELDGAIGIAALSDRSGVDIADLTRGFTAVGEALGIDWAQGMAMQLDPRDPWERLLAAGLARDFQAMRLDFLARNGGKAPVKAVSGWIDQHQDRVRMFRAVVDRARQGGTPTPAMLAQLAGQARVLLSR